MARKPKINESGTVGRRMKNVSFENEHGALWWCNDRYMAYFKHASFQARVANWKETELVAEYYLPNGTVRKQFSLPIEKKEHLIKVLKSDDQESLF